MKIKELYALFLNSDGISTDSRKLKPNMLFFALKGDNFNANNFTQKAFDAGASYCIIDEKQDPQNERLIVVDDVLKTLQQLAYFHRKTLDIPIIALTGSNGKTTTKELINVVLSRAYNIHATQGNYNNHIGVPLTLLEMDSQTQIGIVEMGANHIGEIAELCKIAAPTHGYITNFGKAHLEGFGSEAGVIKGKSELYDYLINNAGFIFVNSDDDKQLTLLDSYKKIHTFSVKKKSDTQVLLSSETPFLNIESQGCLIQSQLLGRYNFSNIAAAITMGCFFKINLDDIKKGVASYTPKNNRSEIIKKGSNTIILDAYNANPSSMEAALDNFNAMKSSAKLVILGDMFELGGQSEKEHLALIKKVNSYNFSQMFFIGLNFFEWASTFPEGTFFETTAAFKEALLSMRIENALVLIKGSRGMALESLVEAF
tara:strand:+ start:577 stop:1860 length:1284 start_codon:yes stop_codon:yes gene_type:complete